MSKLDIGVGDDFPLESGPLDENRDDHRRGRHGHHWRHHHHGHSHRHFHRRGRHGLGGIAVLLVVAGLIALAMQHQLTPAIAYGMIGVGALLLALSVLVRAVFHWRYHRRIMQQVS